MKDKTITYVVQSSPGTVDKEWLVFMYRYDTDMVILAAWCSYKLYVWDSSYLMPSFQLHNAHTHAELHSEGRFNRIGLTNIRLWFRSVVLLTIFIQEIDPPEPKSPASNALLKRERRAEHLGKPKVAIQETLGEYDCM